MLDELLSSLAAPAEGATVTPLHVTVVETTLGEMLIGSTPTALCLAEFTSRDTLREQVIGLQRLMDGAFVRTATPLIDQACTELREYFAGQRRQFSVPLVYPGSAFQRSVWELLQAIPYGQTRSYEALALDLGQRTATRAVGTANGQNRLALFIPCHRVVNKNGRLGGYAGGLWRKQILLDLEQGQHTLV